MTIGRFLIGTSVFSIVTAFIAASPAVAQSTVAAAAKSDQTSRPRSGPSEDTSKEIVVTANRRAEPLSRVGVSVAAVSSAQLALFDVQQPQDLRRVVPGFQAVEAASTGAPVYVLRGVGFDAPTPAISSPVGIYIDEVSVPYPYMSLGLAFDLERVEVLKGPQGTLYGRNTTGGLINFIAAKPTPDFRGSLTVGIGNYRSHELEGYVSGPLGGGFEARLGFQTLNREKGWQRSVTRGDRLGEFHRNALRGTVSFDSHNGLTVIATGSYWHQFGDTVAPQATEFLRDNASLTPAIAASLIPNPTNNSQADFTAASLQPNADLMRRLGIGDPDRPPLRQNTRFYSGTLSARLALSTEIALASLTNYSNLHYDSARDFGGLQTESLTQRSTGHIKSFSQEVRLLGEYTNFNWSVGGYYAKDKTDQQDLGFVGDLTTITGGKAFLPFLNSIFGSRFSADELQATFRNYAGFGDSRVSVLAGFANAEYRFNEQLKVRAGARYTKDRETGSSCALNVNGGQSAFIDLLFPLLTNNFSLPPVGRNSCYTLSSDNSAYVKVNNAQRNSSVAWRLGGDYTPNSNALFYASISRGYKTGSFPVFAAANASQLAPVKPEKLTAYELGTKLRFLNRSLSLNGDVFYYDYRDRQTFGRVPDLVFGSLLRIVNIPKSEVYGAEAEANLSFGRYFTARGSVAYLKTKVKNFVGFDTRSAAGTRVDFAGAALPYSPKLMASGSLSAEVPVGNDLSVLAAGNISYQSRSSAVLGREPGFDIDPFTLVGVKLGLHNTGSRWSVEGYINNLFDTYYFTSAQRGNETLLRYAGMPRTYGVRATVKF